MSSLLPRLWGFRRPREVADAALGALERRVLDVVTRWGACCVRDVMQHLDPPVAYTTAMTTLDRLYRKGMLDRVKQGRAFRYRVVVTTSDIRRTLATTLVDDVLTGDASSAEPLLSSLVDAVSDSDTRHLDTLERLVRDKRAQLQSLAARRTPCE